jgi:hypothetical protein
VTAAVPVVTLLDELDRLREAATPGPWVNDSHEIHQGIPGFMDVPNVGQWIGETCRVDDPRSDADAALIVAAVNAVPRLTAALRGVLALAEDLDGYVSQRGRPTGGSYDYGVNLAQTDAAISIRETIAAALAGGAE